MVNLALEFQHILNTRELHQLHFTRRREKQLDYYENSVSTNMPTIATGTSTNHAVSRCCKGEKCRICGALATHKIEEVIFDDDPFPMRHNWVAYVCCEDFAVIFGEWAHGCVVQGKEMKKNHRWQFFRDLLWGF